jgi:hypothetical protein
MNESEKVINSRGDLPAFFSENGYQKGIEVGVYRGDYSNCIVNGWKGILYLIDGWKHLEHYQDTCNVTDLSHEENYQYVKQRFSGNDNVIIIRKLSHEAVLDFADGSLDWIYIDANHAYEAVKGDLEIWYPKVRSGGTISGHDYFDNGASYGVKRAVDEFFTKLGLQVSQTREQYQSWWVIKP